MELSMFSPKKKVLWFAFYSRLLVIVLQATSNVLIPDHDAGVFISPRDPALRRKVTDKLVDLFLSGFKRWDSQYFLHIAQYGYTYENCLAFYPLFPLLVRYFSYLLCFVCGSMINAHSSLILSATILNLVIFVKSADVFHSLSVKVLRSESKAYKAAVLYCVNPASIFFSAPYSESLFAWMSFYTMYKCTEIETLRFANIDILCCLPCGLSMITRSNGLVNLGFILYTSFKNTLEMTLPEILHKYKTLKSCYLMPFLLLPLVTSLIALMLCILLAIIPFVLFQIYSYLKFCVPSQNTLPDFLYNDKFVMPGSPEGSWCNASLPISYSYIQSHYWDVGFLKYYKLKQVPNFILAFPAIFLVLHNCFVYLKNNFSLCMTLGIKNNLLRPAHMNKPPARPARPQPSRGFGGNDPALFVYVVHAVFLTLFCLVFVHIQVTTRLLCSASPILYWVCSYKINIGPTPTADQNTINEHFRRIGTGNRIPSHHLSIANLEGVDNMYSKWKTFIISYRMPDRYSRMIQYYYLSYFVIGTICFSNFLPWT